MLWHMRVGCAGVGQVLRIRCGEKTPESRTHGHSSAPSLSSWLLGTLHIQGLPLVSGDCVLLRIRPGAPACSLAWCLQAETQRPGPCSVHETPRSGAFLLLPSWSLLLPSAGEWDPGALASLLSASKLSLSPPQSPRPAHQPCLPLSARCPSPVLLGLPSQCSRPLSPTDFLLRTLLWLRLFESF